MATTKKFFFEYNHIKKKIPNIVVAFGQNKNIVLPPAKLNIVLPPAKPWNIVLPPAKLNVVLPPAKLRQYSFGSGQTRYTYIFFPPVFIK